MERPFAPGERPLLKQERISPGRNAFSLGVGKNAIPLSGNNSILTGKEFSLSCVRVKLSCTTPPLSCINRSLSGNKLSSIYTLMRKALSNQAEGFPYFILYKARLISSGISNRYDRGILVRVRSALRLYRFHER